MRYKKFLLFSLIVLVLFTACGAPKKKNINNLNKDKAENKVEEKLNREEKDTTKDIVDKNEPSPEDELKEFTMEEIKKFDGKDGRKAYVVVHDIVYDVTDMPQWKDGKHITHNAGIDITPEMGQSPHGVKVLEDAKVVGKIIKNK